MTTITKDPELRDRLISSSITFMQTVTEVYGPEKGMELWGTIAETVDDNLKEYGSSAASSNSFSLPRRRARWLMTLTPTSVLRVGTSCCT